MHQNRRVTSGHPRVLESQVWIWTQVCWQLQVSAKNEKLSSNHTVKFSKAILRRVKSLEKKGPSQGIIQECERTSGAKSTGSQIRGKNATNPYNRSGAAHRDVWELAKDVRKLKKEFKDTFYFPAEAWGIPKPSSTKPEERYFVSDCGASMHMFCKKDLSSGELETLKRSRSPITVVTANGEVQTNE